EKCAGERERNRAAVEQKERQRAAREEALEAERQEAEKLEEQTVTIGEEHATTREALAGLEERHRGERSAMGKLEQQFQETTSRRNSTTAEIERLGEQRARLLADNIELDRRGAELAADISRMEAAVNEMAVEDASVREALRAGEEELKTLRLAAQECQERRAQIEIELVRKQAELKYLDETSRKELNCPVDELAPAGSPVPDADAIAAAEQGANEIRERIEGLGAVNPAAMEEFQEAQQRQEFLSVQRQDLIDSIRDTEKAIQEIDQVSRQKFAEAFEAINVNFRDMFQTLFGGGIGEMRLTDQENLAESGIDIVCSPPGKRLQNVLLLSGGEKALAAVALLMAIFRYQPSPFCVLDEVDAPLDEANIGRLTMLLKEMSLETQFVVITHSKRTMEAAEALYGVTMQEPGVSRLVAVRLGAAAEAAA
ncbi:MAG: chromosome segregation protein SMC, partial [Bryobacteraceae bacterium]